MKMREQGPRRGGGPNKESSTKSQEEKKIRKKGDKNVPKAAEAEKFNKLR